ncbi:MAG: glycoside hydrolase family 127 protein [Anaerolineales bacterium]|nr:glycoside hydrolase family 127 protein [Anaerolineales bacterium]
MSIITQNISGPVDNTQSIVSKLKVLSNGSIHIKDGFWAHRQEINRCISLKHGYAMLNKAGNLHNLKAAARMGSGEHLGRNFSDETVYKWLEGVAWEIGREPDRELQQMADEVITIIAKAQFPDGYLNSYYQVMEPENRWKDLDFGHELYCAGHFIQAAVAFKRAVDDGRLLQVAVRLADHIESVFGPGKKEGTSGHPCIEMALLELFRTTGHKRYLTLAQFFLDQRGKKKMKGMGANGPEYHQDHVPVRGAKEVAGHAVRQAYLATAIADAYMETGETAMLETAQRLWNDMVHGKMYITGGIGARYDGESFGEDYELPTDQCYCETCAAIGNFFWNWRMLLISGESRYADLMEKLIYNGILSSPGLNGTSYFYVNPLMLRSGQYVRLSTNPSEESDAPISGRPEWHSVACCPPNVMRLLSSLQAYFVTQDTRGIQIHQYGNFNISTTTEDFGSIALTAQSEYPWHGSVNIRILNSDEQPWKLSLRIPGWCRNYTVKVDGRLEEPKLNNGYASIQRSWKAGDTVEIKFIMHPVTLEPDPRIDAIRGCIALQHGPVLYCLEGSDQPSINLLDVKVDPSSKITSHWREELLEGITTLELDGYLPERLDWQQEETLFRPVKRDNKKPLSGKKVTLTAIPYFAWGNRGLNSMRVWIPRTDC